MADNKIIYELIKEVRDDQKELQKGTTEHRESLIKWHTETNARLDKYNDQLEVHIEGVNTLKALHGLNVKRLEKLEESSKIRAFLGNKIVKISGSVGVIAGAILAITKLIDKL